MATRIIPADSQNRGHQMAPRWMWLSLSAATLLLVSGCASPGGGRSAVDQLHLLTIPLAVNFDNAPGADGFAIKVYASLAGEPKPVAISRGSVEILMYDGVIRTTDLETARPLRTWTFADDTLRDRQYTTSIGVGYQFALPWGDAKPTADRITVLARYRSPDGKVTASLPSSIVTNNK
jgi:hypothetical protein